MKIAKIDASIETTLPAYATAESAGLDLIATSKTEVLRTYDAAKQRWVGGYIEYGTNLAVEIPAGFVGLLVPKSSSRDRTQTLANDLGVLDSDYRGEVKFSYVGQASPYGSHYGSEYEVGEAVGQLLIMPVVLVGVLQFVDYAQLSVTGRGTGGHGSTENAVPQSPAAPAPSEKGAADEPVSPETASEAASETLPDLRKGGEVLTPAQQEKRIDDMEANGGRGIWENEGVADESALAFVSTTANQLTDEEKVAYQPKVKPSHKIKAK